MTAAALPSGETTAEVRLGRWQDVLADIECDALISDTPYGERTHGSKAKRFDGSPKAGLAPEYKPFTPADVREFVEHWHGRTRGWMAIMSCSDLAPVWRAEFERAGRVAFAPLPCVIRGMSVRLHNDGPSSWSVLLNVARPRSRDMARWGVLDGTYIGNAQPGASGGRGKPAWLVQAIVRDYSRPGDLVCDPCAGWGTTLTAARKLGRHAIGAEMDRAAYEIADRTLRGMDPRPTPEQPSLFDLLGSKETA